MVAAVIILGLPPLHAAPSLAAGCCRPLLWAPPYSLSASSLPDSCAPPLLQYQRKGQITDEVLFGRGRQ